MMVCNFELQMKRIGQWEDTHMGHVYRWEDSLFKNTKQIFN
jgi:hypothetical protein